MQILPDAALRHLELPVLRNEVQKFALGAIAKNEIQKEKVAITHENISEMYQVVNAHLQLLERGADLSLHAYDDVKPSLEKLKAKGYILEQQEVVAIYKQLKIVQALLNDIKGLNDTPLAPLTQIIQNLPLPNHVISECEALFTEDFDIRKDASPELQKIQRSIDRAKRQLDREFKNYLKLYNEKAYLTDTAETIRNGRRVLSVKSEYKRKIKGIIHDESSSGKVCYIEPEGILEINNDLFDLKQSRKREIIRLLRQLCEIIHLNREDLRLIQDIIVRLDVVRAKAKFGYDIGGICPNVIPKPKLHIVKGKHPLLMLHFRNKDEKVVPFDLELYHQNRILIVSGPNAGGKTILMKSVGLLQLMVQSAIPVPVGEQSEFGVFHKIFVDIGDQQSLEDDLSTYSSHLHNMKSFVDNASDQALVLIDELGSGTDPRIGGAIAEAILHELFNKNVHAVITTHYSNLKNYAHRQKGIVNGAMSFDNEHLSPTYELLIGKPGSSFAFELAQKSELPKRILENAKKNAGDTLVNIDKMLSDIQSQRKMLKQRIREVESREKKIDQLRHTYERMRKDIEAQRKKLKMMAKEYDISKGVQIDKALQELIDEIKKSKDLKKANKLAKEQQAKQQEAVSELSRLEEEEWKERQADKNRKIEEGDYVKVRKTGTVGQVERIEKGKAYINTGKFQLEAKLKDLFPANAPMEVNKQKSVKVHADPSKSKTLKSKLDIRGMPRAEANKMLEKYFDQALMQGLHRLEIIHGKGSGVLKQLVREKAKNLSAIESVEHPPDEAGGEGVSIITI